MIEPSRPGLLREVGTWGLALLVLNSMIGAGIFALPGTVAAQVGEWGPWLFLVIGGLFLSVVFCFAALSSYFEESGGPVLYANTAFGPVAGFLAGWLTYVSRMTAFSANATAMALYLGAIWSPVASGAGRALFIALVCVVFTWANYRGVRDGVRTVSVFTLFKLLPLVLLVLLGLKSVSGDALLPAQLPAVEDFGGLTLLFIYAFIGFEAPTTVGAEARRARVAMPRAIWVTVVAVALFYFLVVLVFVAVLPPGEREGATLVDVGRRLMGDWGALLIGLAAVFSIGGNLAANMLSVPRLSFSLGELGLLPAWFSRVHPRFHTPGNSVLLLGALCLVFALSGSFVFLATASSLMRILTYILCIAALPGVRRQASMADRERAFVLPLGPLIPVLALLLCLWMASRASLEAWGLGAALVAAGFALYWLAAGRR